MHNTTSSFPGTVDTRHFFSDVQLQHADIHNGYNDRIKSANYQGASQFLYTNVEQANVDMDYSGAYLVNRYDNMIVAIENYVLSMAPTNARPVYSRTEPTNVQVQTVWVY